MQRVKDVDQFLRELNRPLPGDPVGDAVSEVELERDAQSFMAFASAFGVRPPKAGAEAGSPAALPSAPAS